MNDVDIKDAHESCSLAPLSLTERFSVGGLSFVQAALFGWAAWVLPWQSWTTFAGAAGLLAIAHATTAISQLTKAPVAQTVWKVASLIALAFLVFVTWQVFGGGAYLARLYGALGEGLFAAMLGIWGLFVLLTLPTACWGLVRTRHCTPRLGRIPWIGSAATLAALAVATVSAGTQPRVHHLADVENAPASLAALSRLFYELPVAPTRANRRGDAWKISRRGPAVCDAPPSAAPVTLIATFARPTKPGYRSVCVQSATLEAAVGELEKALVQRAARSTIKLDVITGVASLAGGPDWVETLSLRPGLDGVCVAGRCWMPWQLVVRDAFLENRPLDFIPDLRFGASQVKLAEQLALAAEPADDELVRITTRSWTLTEQGLTELSRMRPVQVAVNDQAVTLAAHEAQQHIVEAQLDSGKFRYLLHPFSGKAERKSFSLARQAGTVFALCELGDTSTALQRTIEKGLRLLAKYEKADAASAIGGLTQHRSRDHLELEGTALPLVAFLVCRERVGDVFDPVIRRLSQLVLSVEDGHGRFLPAFDLVRQKPIEGPEPLYAPGQSILALIYLERLLSERPELALADLSRVREVRARAMTQIAQEHWPHALYPFFFIEENWHCLAARAALDVARNPDYEQFCLDYIKFKSRLILEEDSDVDAGFVGGFGFGNVIPPHNTGAAGFGEALSAAIAVKHARGESIAAEQRLLEKVLGFLQRQQWTEQNCFGCTADALGGISEHTHSPITRIDFVQHTWAALGHGQRALQL
jgi:hypothetical protein